MKRCGIETKLVIPGDVESRAHIKTIQAIQNALGKALKWNEALITGTVTSMTELAKLEGVSQRYISSLIKLAFLSPDIMKSHHPGRYSPAHFSGHAEEGLPLGLG